MTEATLKRSALTTLQAGRAFAALAVVMFHVEVTLVQVKYAGRALFPFFFPGYSGVEFFFVLSGFVIFLAHRHDFGRPDKILSYFIKRARRLYPPLWIVLTLLIPAGYFFFKGNFVLSALPSAYLIAPIPGDPWLTVEWTLRHEVLFYLLFGLTLLLPRTGLTILFAWFFVSFLSIFFTLPSKELAFLFQRHHIFFLFGIASAFLYVNHKINYAKTWVISGAILFAIAWCANIFHPVQTAPFEAAYGIGSFLMITGMVQVERKGSVNIPKFLILLGDASYSIYLVHLPVISVLAKLLTNLYATPYGGSIAFCICAAGSILSGVYFHIYLERPILNKLTIVTDKILLRYVDSRAKE